jgi:hypothetical protein
MNDYWNRPCAAQGLISYRYQNGRYGWIMIGAVDDDDAANEAKRSTGSPIDRAKLQRWNGSEYA